MAVPSKSSTVQPLHDKTIDQAFVNDAGGIAAQKNNFQYFRHKGIKIKYENIEQVLLRCKYIRAIAVISREDIEGIKRLTAYLVANGEYNKQGIIEYAQSSLPLYMVPEKWACLDGLPTDAKGLIDKSVLKEPDEYADECRETDTPLNASEARLSEIIGDILKMPSVNVHENFFRLGGTSLQAIRVISAIRKEFHLEVDIRCFFTYPTVAKLARYVNGISDTSKAEPANSLDPLVNSLYKSIIPVKDGNSKVPLYIVCGGGGTAFTFEKFAQSLSRDQQVYVFQHSYDIEELKTFPGTIEEIAERYVQELLVANPGGPYALSGHCIGGAIALEMARKLKDMGKEIKMLAMFDVILSKENVNANLPGNKLKQIPGRVKSATSKAYLKFDFETFLLRRYPKDALEYKLNNLKSFVNKIYQFRQENQELVVYKKFEKKFEDAFENYRVNKYDGDILVFYALDHYHFRDRDRNIQFKKLILQDETKERWKNFGNCVTFYEIEGEHSTIFNSKDFAILLQSHLDS